MARVLITGAAGFIGMHTAIRFLKGGWDVIGIDNINNYYSVDLKRDRLSEICKIAQIEKGSFRMYEIDINSTIWSDLDNLEIHAVIHLAAQAGVRYSIEKPVVYLESNIVGFQRVLDYVKDKQIRRFVYASSSSVYGKTSKQPFHEEEPCNSPESYYAATKKANELMAKAYWNTYGQSSVGLRFFTVYGPWGRPDMAPFIFTKACYENKTIKVFNNGKQKRDFTFITDIVEGIYQIITIDKFPESASVLNIGKGSPVGLLEFIHVIEQATNKILDKEFTEPQIGDVEETFADTSRLKQFVDFEPSVGLKEGISELVKWYASYYLE